jgi:peptidyl-dipeptidase Dcp
MSISLTDITIRTGLQPGDIGYITYMHGHLYKKEYNYGMQFETYVALGLCEFVQQYDAQKTSLKLKAESFKPKANTVASKN